MRILLTFLHKDPSGVALARRSVPYDQMIILATGAQTGQARILLGQELQTTNLEAQRPRIVTVDADDPDGCVGTIERLFEELGRHEITFNIAADHPTLTYAAFLACLRMGRPAHFFLHDRVARLPVMSGLRLVETFEPAEADLMMKLNSDPLLSRAGKGIRQILLDRTLSGLKRKGVVRLAHSPEGLQALLTAEGSYYVAQLLELSANKLRTRGLEPPALSASLRIAPSESVPSHESIRLLRPQDARPWGQAILERPLVRPRRGGPRSPTRR